MWKKPVKRLHMQGHLASTGLHIIGDYFFVALQTVFLHVIVVFCLKLVDVKGFQSPEANFCPLWTDHLTTGKRMLA